MGVDHYVLVIFILQTEPRLLMYKHLQQEKDFTDRDQRAQGHFIKRNAAILTEQETRLTKLKYLSTKNKLKRNKIPSSDANDRLLWSSKIKSLNHKCCLCKGPNVHFTIDDTSQKAIILYLLFAVELDKSFITMQQL